MEEGDFRSSGFGREVWSMEFETIKFQVSSSKFQAQGLNSGGNFLEERFLMKGVWKY